MSAIPMAPSLIQHSIIDRLLAATCARPQRAKPAGRSRLAGAAPGALVAVAAALLAAPASWAASWPGAGWPMAGGDPAHDGRARVASAGEPTAVPGWPVMPDGATVSSPPVVSPDGTIYVGAVSATGGAPGLYALEPSGRVRWVFATADGEVDAAPAVGPDGTVYAATKGATLYALSPDGALRWAFSPPGASILAAPTVGADGVVYLGSDGGVYALRPDGSVLWHAPLATISSPSVGSDGTVYVAFVSRAAGGRGAAAITGALAALGPGGRVRWSRVLERGVFAIPWAPPALAGDGMVYVATLGGDVAAYTRAGARRWSFHTGSAVRALVVQLFVTAVVFGSGRQELRAELRKLAGEIKRLPPRRRRRARAALAMLERLLHEAAGRRPSRRSIEDAVRAFELLLSLEHARLPPALRGMHENVLGSPAIDPRGTVYVDAGAVGGETVYALGARRGDERWTFPVAAVFSPALDTRGDLYVPGEDGRLYELDQHGRLLWLSPFLIAHGSGAALSSPAIGPDGTVYVSAAGRLYAFAGPRSDYALRAALTTVLTHFLRLAKVIEQAASLRCLPCVAALVRLLRADTMHWERRIAAHRPLSARGRRARALALAGLRDLGAAVIQLADAARDAQRHHTRSAAYHEKRFEALGARATRELDAAARLIGVAAA